MVSVLSTIDAAAGRVDQHDVGERAADVDGQSPIGCRSKPSAIAQVLSRWGEHVEDPDLVQLVVADEDAVAMPHGPRREVDLARARARPASRSSGSPMRKSSLPRTMMPSCS